MWGEEKDSMFNVAVEERCQSLRVRILQWERENQENLIAQRADTNANKQH